MFEGWMIDGKNSPATLRELDESLLTGDTLIKVHSSSINYKDALALHGRPGVARSFPLIAGIDVSGEVLESTHERWRPGDLVTINGAGLGETHHGGLATLARVNGDHLVRIPASFSATQASAVGTAGFTAQLAVLALEKHGLIPDQGPVLVTGAGGGAGSYSLALLAALGYEVVAATGRPEELADRLMWLGASSIVHRDEVAATRQPLASERWAGVIDGVGGSILSGALAATRSQGGVAAYGLAASGELSTTVMPFILRGVSLLGINSVLVHASLRQQVWDRLATGIRADVIDAITHTVPLEGAYNAAKILLEGNGTGRTVVLASSR